MSDDLLRRLRDGDPDAQRELFEYCNERLRPFLLRKLPNPADLDDCTSEVVTRALEGIERGHQPRVLGAWLIGIAKNVLKERYEAKNLAGGELPDDIAAPAGMAPLELDPIDLPEHPSEYEVWVGKRQLWDTLLAATGALSSGLAAIVRTHMELTLRRGRLVVGNELAEAVGQPVEIVNRQLNRGKGKMLDVLVPLVLARNGHTSCPALAGVLQEILRPDQRNAGRKLVLDAAQASTVLSHASGCAACAPQVDEARDFSRWALGPGLVGLANDDDDERRRAIIAMLDRAGDSPLAAQSPAAAMVTVLPAPLVASSATGAPPAGLIERIRTAVATKAAMLPRPDAVMQFAQQNPDAFHRAVTAIASGVVVAAAVVITMLATNPPSHHDASPPAAAPTTTTPASPALAPPTTSSEAPAPPAPATTTTTAAPVVAPAPRPQAQPTTSSSPPSTTTNTTTEQPPPPPPPPPPPRGDTVVVDATDLDYAWFRISGVSGQHDSRQQHQLKLTPGPYTLTTAMNQTLAFRVTEDRRVDYDQSQEGTLTGKGSSTLAVHGRPVTLDATDVDYNGVGVGGAYQTTERRHVFRLLPGAHYLVLSSRGSHAFTITPDGKIQYDPKLEGQLTGTGTTTLAIHGFRITLDATDLDYSGVGVGGTFQTTDRRHTFRLLPGAHYLVVSSRGSHAFTITDNGRVGYDTKLEGQLTGAGSTTLAVHGFPVTVDVDGLSYSHVSIGGVVSGVSRPPRTYRLLPGAHYAITVAAQTVVFTVTDSGKVQYDPKLEGQVAGAGTTTLVIRGFPVTINVDDVSYINVSVSGVANGVPRPPRTYRLIPGGHYLVTAGGQAVPFTVTDTGKVQYDPKLEGLLTGADTATLGVHGFAVTVDATASELASYVVGGVGTFDARRTQVVRLVPGAHEFVGVQDGRRYVFQVTAAGRIDYDPSLDAVLSGRGTGTLTVRRPRG